MIDSKIVHECLDAIFTGASIDVGAASEMIGLRAHVGELYNTEIDGVVHRVYIQLYTECALPIQPGTDDGFTVDDVSSHEGIIVAIVGDRTDPPTYRGITHGVDEFIEAYQIESGMADIVRGQMEQLRIAAMPRDAFLEQATSLYHDRLPGAAGAVRERLLC